jgi:hypothetical protein
MTSIRTFIFLRSKISAGMSPDSSKAFSSVGETRHCALFDSG